MRWSICCTAWVGLLAACGTLLPHAPLRGHAAGGFLSSYGNLAPSTEHHDVLFWRLPGDDFSDFDAVVVERPVMRRRLDDSLPSPAERDERCLALQAAVQRELGLAARPEAGLRPPPKVHDDLDHVGFVGQVADTLRDLRGQANESAAAAERAEQRLADRRDVERAKSIVSARLGLGEDEAYRWLRQSAMDARLPLGDLARQVLASESAEE